MYKLFGERLRDCARHSWKKLQKVGVFVSVQSNRYVDWTLTVVVGHRLIVLLQFLDLDAEPGPTQPGLHTLWR